jgi:hypothetical protein
VLHGLCELCSTPRFAVELYPLRALTFTIGTDPD